MAAQWISEAECLKRFGPGKTEKLLQRMVGKDLYIPLKPRKSHLLAEVLGIQGMAYFCREYGGLHISLPTPQRRTLKEIIIENLGKGMDVGQVARLAGTSKRYVFMVKSNIKEST